MKRQGALRKRGIHAVSRGAHSDSQSQKWNPSAPGAGSKSVGPDSPPLTACVWSSSTASCAECLARSYPRSGSGGRARAVLGATSTTRAHNRQTTGGTSGG
jgi:hypothetical protein